MKESGLAVARGCLQRAAPVLQVVAGAWATTELGSAMVDLLCSAVGVAGTLAPTVESHLRRRPAPYTAKSPADAADATDVEMFEFIGNTAVALGPHHPAAAATVASQLAQTWGRKAYAAADAAAVAPCCEVLQQLSGLVTTAAATAAANAQLDDVATAVDAARIFLLHAPAALAGGGGLGPAAAAVAGCLGRPEPNVYGPGLSCLAAFEAAVETDGPAQDAVAQALAEQAAAVAAALAGGLCGRCDGGMVGQTAKLLRWLLGRFDPHVPGLSQAALQGFAEAGAAVGDGTGLMTAMAQDVDAWAADAEQLWRTMR